MIATGHRVALRRAAPHDAALAHQWLAQSDLTAHWLGPPWFAERQVPGREQFEAQYAVHYFNGRRPFEGRVLMLRSAAIDLGVLAWHRVDLMRDLVELEIWLAGSEFSRKGIAAEALDLACDWLQANFGVNRFLLRPSRRNVRALRCARRAGFRETDFEAADVADRLGLRPSPYRDAVLLFRILPLAKALAPAHAGDLDIFIDSEFSSLESPVLLSVGAVSADGQTFYAEIEPERAPAYSQFVVDTVLPLMEQGAIAREAAAHNFVHWMRRCAAGRTVRLISDSGYDRWALGELLDSEDLPERVRWRRAPVAYAELDRLADELRLRRHHALDDALALRRAVLGEIEFKLAGGQDGQAVAPGLAV